MKARMAMKNYRIAEHPYYHAARCAVATLNEFTGVAWREFIKPVSIVACGVAIGMPLAWILGTAMGVIFWR